MHIQLRPREVRATFDERRARIRDVGFGTAFTEHMVSVRWSVSRGWHDAELVPYAPLTLSPSVVGLHYGQIVFEGLKAFRLADGRTAVFRPEAHARRLQASARRLMMPEPPVELFADAVTELTRIDQEWLPDDPAMSLYLRPILFAAEETLALRPATEYRFLVVAFVTEGYFGPTLDPVTVWLSEDYTRAAPGGTGAAKCPGNYAGSLAAQEQAKANGCDQVVWLDAQDRKLVEEMGGMNLWFVHGQGAGAHLVTPPLDGTILPGITRDCLLKLIPELGFTFAEAPVSVREWREGCATGAISEVFACGTAARISPVGEVRSAHGRWSCGSADRPVTDLLSAQLFGIQRGELPDAFGWLHPVD